jgi:hypothetical protein
MEYRIETLPREDGKAATAISKLMKAHGADNHPVLKELGLYTFWGATTMVMYNEDDVPVSLNCTKIGKRKKNVFEPYANWYGAYTLPTERRKGYARELYFSMESAALIAGCRRIKSLAGSSAGLGLHMSLGHQCWGKTANNEVWVDSPLPEHAHLYKGLTPPQAPGPRMLVPELKQLLKQGLRYDHG